MGSRFILLIAVCSFGSLQVLSQTCLQKLDSAETFKYSNPEKARFYASSLLIDLDSAKCLEEIGIAGTYNNIGLILWNLNDKKRGLDAFLSGLSHELAIKDSTNQDLLGLYFNLSSLYQEVGNYSEAGKYLALAEKVTNENFGNDQEARRKLLTAEGLYYREVGDFEKSLEALFSATGIASDDSIKVSLKIEIGTTYRYFGDLEKSEQQLLEAVELAQSTDELLYLQAIDRLSSLKIEQGEYSDSEEYLLKNLETKEEKYADDPILMLETLNELGFLYYRLNDLSEAQKYLQQALDEGEDIRTLRPYMLNNLGTIYMKQGEIEAAEKYFIESAEGFKEIYGSINQDYASSLNNLAAIYKEKGDYSKALSTYLRVLDMDRVIYGTNHARYATSLNNVALIYLQLGNMSIAEKYLVDCKRIREETLGVYHPLYIKTVNDLGMYYLIIGDSIPAMNEFNLALKSEIKHLQDVFPVLTDNQRKLYFKTTRSNIERFSSLAFQKQFIKTQYAENALNHFINTKGILFYASEKMRRLIQSSGDKKLIATYERWREVKYKLAQSYLLTEGERSLQGISIEKLEEESTDLEKNLGRSFKVFSDQEKSSSHSWQEISLSLAADEALVEVIQYRNYTVKIGFDKIEQGFERESNYVAFVIKSDSVLAPIVWSNENLFEKNFNLYKNAMKFGVRDKTSYKVFWRPIDLELRDVSKIYYSPDGIFHKLNPVVFYNDDLQKYVVDEYNIINVTSGKDLIYKQESDLRRVAEIFGNPDFTKVKTEYKLNPLPGAEKEANEISEILDVRRWKSEAFFNEEVTEERIKQLANPGIIHIATHGYFLDDPDLVNPLYSSGLYLSRTEGSSNDGLLSSYEAMNLVLDETNLVVLAACETGLGTVQNGEGVFGLQRAFLVAGADNIILSLVKINDEAARKFMTLYYKALIELEDPQEAFFNARAAFKKEDPNPYNWGAYILVSKG